MLVKIKKKKTILSLFRLVRRFTIIIIIRVIMGNLLKILKSLSLSLDLNLMIYSTGKT